jgi:hypothetical protein
MKALRRLAEIDIITRGVTVKIQQVAVHGNYENPTNDAKGRWVERIKSDHHDIAEILLNVALNTINQPTN